MKGLRFLAPTSCLACWGGTLFFAALLSTAVADPASPPQWWTDKGIWNVGEETADNHAAANIGQAKWMARMALESLEAACPSVGAAVRADLVGPGKPIDTFEVPPAPDDAWRNRQRAPLLIGQLKAIAKPFHVHLATAAPYWLALQMRGAGVANADVLDSLNYGDDFTEVDPDLLLPWTEHDAADDANRAMANIGQLKASFDIDFGYDEEPDGIPDLFEWNYFGSMSVARDLDGDADGDLITNRDEIIAHPDPALRDLDGDGISDLVEIQNGTDHLFSNPADSDSDGLPDDVESNTGYFYADWDTGTDPGDPDSDNDGLSDGWETKHLSQEKELRFPGVNWSDFLLEPPDWAMFPDEEDSNGDEIPDDLEDFDDDDLVNGQESMHGGNPYKADTDSDGLNDGQEVADGTSLTNPDTDGDGIWDSDEPLAGPNPPIPAPEDPHGAENPFRFVVVEGAGAEKGVPRKQTRTIPLPPFSSPRVVVVAAFSTEYPTWTGQFSEYDDGLRWKVTSTTGTNESGSLKVNDYHLKWQDEAIDVSDFEGAPTAYGPAALAKTFIVPGTNESGGSIQIECQTTNIADANYPSALYVGLFPLEVVDPQGKPLKEVRIANMDEEGAVVDDDGLGELAPRLSRDNFRVNLKGSANIKKSPPLNFFEFEAPEIEIETIDAEEVAGHAFDHNDEASWVRLGEPKLRARETKKSILVSDEHDDAAMGEGSLDEYIDDTSHISQLGGKLLLKSIKVYGEELDVGYKIPVKKHAVVHLDVWILKGSNGAPVYGENQVADRLIRAREIFAQTGLWLAWTIHPSIPRPYGVRLEDGLDETSMLYDDPTVGYPNDGIPVFSEFEALCRGLDSSYDGDDPDFHDYGTVGDQIDLNVFYVNYIQNTLSEDPRPPGVPSPTIGMAYWPPSRAPYRSNIFISAAASEDPTLLAHEVGHAVMQYGHQLSEILLMDEDAGPWGQNVRGQKRITLEQEERIMNAGFVEPVDN